MQRWFIVLLLLCLSLSMGGTFVYAGARPDVAHPTALPPRAPVQPTNPAHLPELQARAVETTPPVRLSEPPAERLALTATDALTLTGTSNNARFGAAASTAGDVNGDGFADLLIGVPGESAVQVYYGSATGISSTPDTTLSGAGNFGRAVSIAGDINNDGFADVIIGTPGQNTAALFRGAATGISTTPLELSQPGGFGASVATAGDVDGDGFDDVLVGAPNTDLVYLFSGASLAADQTDPTVTLSGSGNFGTALDTAGDVNGDGFADIVVGAPGATPAMSILVRRLD
ncbi:MAG: hypothetical protein HC876_05615 [Chloroflexaceae bacterium]|nr:hypothetical protein [Chloroflexaceae bacterium]